MNLDELYESLEQHALQDPENLERIRSLRKDLDRSGWLFEGKSIDQWIDELLANDKTSPGGSDWAVRSIGILIVPALIDVIKDSKDPDSDAVHSAIYAMEEYPILFIVRAA